MSTVSGEGFILRVLRAFDEDSNNSDLSWRTDEGYAPVTFFVNCNDFFAWACADDEKITPENIGVLEQAAEDMRPLGMVAMIYAPLLFVARVRGMRPQGAYYDLLPPETWHLFDACGPARATSIGNPKKHPSERG